MTNYFFNKNKAIIFFKKKKTQQLFSDFLLFLGSRDNFLIIILNIITVL